MSSSSLNTITQIGTSSASCSTLLDDRPEGVSFNTVSLSSLGLRWTKEDCADSTDVESPGGVPERCLLIVCRFVGSPVLINGTEASLGWSGGFDGITPDCSSINVG